MIKSLSDKNIVPDTPTEKVERTQASLLPGIFWIYTNGEVEVEVVDNLISLYHLNHTAHFCDYDVRFVNSRNAYGYLSP